MRRGIDWARLYDRYEATPNVRAIDNGYPAAGGNEQGDRPGPLRCIAGWLLRSICRHL